tara:strand:- start:932 stop:1360 length:429 start_codon:yes stop_codon:yes gene_type:complete
MMSYYNYIYRPLKADSEEAKDRKLECLHFHESDDGFENLRKTLGEEYVHECTDHLLKGVKCIILMEVAEGSVMIRPRDLDMNLTHCGRQVFIGDADCCVLVSDTHNRIDWSEVEDIEAMEKALKAYQDHQENYQEPLLVYPE